MIELGDRVFVQLRGKRLERLGAKGFMPRLFQIVEVRAGKIVSIRDYARREDALAAAGHHEVSPWRPPRSSTSTGRCCGGRRRSLSPARSAQRGLISRWQLRAPPRGSSSSSRAARATSRCGARPRTACAPARLHARGHARRSSRDAMEPVLRPLVYAEPLELVEQHRERGEPVYIVSATLQEIVEAIADDLGFDGALGTVCEVRGRRVHGPRGRALHAESKASCVRELASSRLRPRGVHRVLRQPHRPAVPRGGRASRRRQSRTARCGGSRRERGWPVLEFKPPCSLTRASPAPGARLRTATTPRRCGEHFDDAEQRGKLGHGLLADRWLETLDGFDPAARAAARPGRRRLRALGRQRRDRLPRARRRSSARSSTRPPEQARLVVCEQTFPTGMLGHYARRLASAVSSRSLTATSPRAARPTRTARSSPARIRSRSAIPSSDGEPLVTDVSMGAVTWGDVIAGLAREDQLVPFGGEQWHKAFALALGLQLLVDALVQRAGPRRGASRRAAGDRPGPARSAPTGSGSPATSRRSGTERTS